MPSAPTPDRSTPSDSCWASIMVFLTGKRAVCCSLLVMNGGTGFFFRSLVWTEETMNGALARSLRTAFDSASFVIFAAAPSQVRVDHIALNWTGAHDSHFDDKIVEADWLEPRQHRHLRPRLDLEDAHRVRGADHGEDIADVLRQAVQVQADGAVGADVTERVIDG